MPVLSVGPWPPNLHKSTTWASLASPGAPWLSGEWGGWFQGGSGPRRRKMRQGYRETPCGHMNLGHPWLTQASKGRTKTRVRHRQDVLKVGDSRDNLVPAEGSCPPTQTVQLSTAGMFCFMFWNTDGHHKHARGCNPTRQPPHTGHGHAPALPASESVCGRGRVLLKSMGSLTRQVWA